MYFIVTNIAAYFCPSSTRPGSEHDKDYLCYLAAFHLSCLSIKFPAANVESLCDIFNLVLLYTYFHSSSRYINRNSTSYRCLPLCVLNLPGPYMQNNQFPSSTPFYLDYKAIQGNLKHHESSADEKTAGSGSRLEDRQ